MLRTLLHAVIWTIALASLAAATIVASAFALMATSLDPVEAIQAGLEPWTDALYAALAFLGVLATTGLALLAWHSRRFKPVGALLVLVQAGVVAWACLRVYAEYF